MERQSTFNRNPITWIKDFWFLAKPYWKSEEKYKALSLITVVIVLNLLTVYMTVAFNKWNNVFYNAIQNYDKDGFLRAILKFCFLAFFYILFQVLAYYFKQILEIKWRKWLTRYYLENWFRGKAYYKTKFLDEVSDNPDQRICEDINSFIVLALDLTLGLMNSVVTLVSFVVILWGISGVWTFNLAKYHFVIPGYMVWAALLYAIVGTYITFKIGKPLIKLNYLQQAYEADFRFGLMRVREHSESIAFYDGEKKEEVDSMNRFNNVINNFVALIYRHIKIDIFSVGYAQAAVIFPIVVAAPRYFAKVIKLGDLMQILSAFNRVQGALSYFIDAYSSLSGWRAVMDRLYGFQVAVHDADALTGLPLVSGKNYLELKNLEINLPNGMPLRNNISCLLNTGDRLLIRGRSGSGKTTLLRTIAGLWHYASGEIIQKPGLHSLFIAQKPYLPIGTLKETIYYPKITNLPSDKEVIALLNLCNLSHLESQLHISNDWGSTLSLGEQQRIAFCRILVNKPDIIYLDEATSALDEEAEEQFYGLLNDQLPKAVIVSVGHRSTIKKWHNYELNFNQLCA